MSPHRWANIGCAVVYSIAAGMAFGSLFLPLYEGPKGGPSCNDYLPHMGESGHVLSCTYQTYLAEVHRNGMVSPISVSDSGCPTFRFRMYAGAAMAVIAGAASLLVAFLALADAGLVTCAGLLAAVGPRAFGLLPAALGATAFASLAAAFGIVVGHYYAANPCNHSSASLSDDPAVRIGSGVTVTLIALISIAAAEAFRFFLRFTGRLPPRHSASAQCRISLHTAAEVRRGMHMAVIVLAFLALVFPLFATETDVRFDLVDDSSRPSTVTQTRRYFSFWRHSIVVWRYAVEGAAEAQLSYEVNEVCDLQCLSAYARVGAAFAIVGAITALFGAVRGSTVRSVISRLVVGPQVAEAGTATSLFLTRAAVASDVCCFACIWAALIQASYLFLEVRCDGQLALANRGYRIAPDASPSGYVSLLSAAVASAVALIARAVEHCFGGPLDEDVAPDVDKAGRLIVVVASAGDSV